ncbi:DUF6188 family protein [Kitasatospora sp. NPDC002040]|uniref:DUF6188 family protein n=1 Tax=Kitasatospora sp. NPDC002040 TaxID=3154661 RepID=UPI00332025DD
MTESIAEVLAGRQVEGVRAGAGVRLELAGAVTVLIDSDFRLLAAGGVEHFYPQLGTGVGRGLAVLTGSRVTGAAATPAGGLEVSFDCGRRLAVPADTTDRPWQILTAGTPLFTAEPGGYLTG